jgi:uncharacterized membrane protein
MKHQLIIASALAAVFASASPTSFADINGKEKCYGIAKAAHNDCANLAGTHSCAGMAVTDNDPGEWKLIAKGTCESLGGLSKEQAEVKLKQQKSNP